MSEQTELTISVPEAGRHFGFSKNHSYLAAARGDLPVIRIGRRVRVPVEALKKMLEKVEIPPAA
jgi:excisionase family DNA binding protein